MSVGLTGFSMLELVGFITICYLIAKVAPSAVKFSVKAALALLFIVLSVLLVEFLFIWWYNMPMVLYIARGL